MSGVWLWLLVPVAPLLATILLLAPRGRVISWLWVVCLPALAAAFWPPEALDLPWLWADVRWGGDDLLTRAWLGFSAFLWGCAGVFAVSSMADDPRRRRFWLFWLLSLAGNFLLIIAADALSFYLGFSLMSLSAYGLIVHQGGPAPRRAGRLYLQLAICGEMLLLAALLMRTYAADGAFRFASWESMPIDGLTLVLLLIGLGLKAGFWPLHVWLPLAHPAAPAPASAVLSGAMIKAGILGIWRCLPESDPLLVEWSTVLLAVGMFGAFYGALLGVCSEKAKAALAYSSISQMGYFVMILALAWRDPENIAAITTVLIIFGVHHGLAKGALFLGAGLSHRFRLPWVGWVLLALPALALIGAPLTSGGAGKGVLKSAFGDGHFAAWQDWLSLGSVATGVLLLRACWLMREDEKSTSERAPFMQLMPWALLCLAPVALPWIWPTLRSALFYGFGLADTWKLLWPLLVALGIGAVALRMGWRVPRAVRDLPDLASLGSLKLKGLTQRPPMAVPRVGNLRERWRPRERRWNRFWRSGALALSAWLMGLSFWLGWLW
ncbi:proton-conducting transporter transmembrane domain-containing protein [Pseudomonas sp. Marseille-QA0892]